MKLCKAKETNDEFSCTKVLGFVLGNKSKEKPTSVSAWKFGADPDHLAQLVIDGVKTATCSGLIFYEIENEPLPSVGDYSIILSSKDVPLAIIETTEVKTIPMNEVPEDFAVAEGEGDQIISLLERSPYKFFY